MHDQPARDCASSLMGEALKRALDQLLADEERAPRTPCAEHSFEALKTLEEGASWAAPSSAEGALIHLMLAAGDAGDLPRLEPEHLEAAEQRTRRNLHAVFAFLWQTLEAEDQSRLRPLVDNYLGSGFEEVNPLLAYKLPQRATATPAQAQQ